MLEGKKLSFRYKKQPPVFEDVSFSLPEGEVLSIETAQQPVPGGGEVFMRGTHSRGAGFEAWARYEEETPAF